MSWASRRRALIITIVSSVVIAVLAIFAFSIFYETPTCFDKKQNQDELGPDCGGGCTTLCATQVRSLPSARFVRMIEPRPGRTDIVAYVDNPNPNAESRNAAFTLELFDTSGESLGTKEVRVDLPPSATVPVYLGDVAQEGETVARAFLTYDAAATVWTRPAGEVIWPEVLNITPVDGPTPRITASLQNPTAKPVYNTTLVASVFDEAGNVMAASQTFVSMLPPQGTSPLTFTWNEPFPAPITRVEILPVPKLPRSL